MVLLLLIVATPLHAKSTQSDKVASTLYSDALTSMRAKDYDSAVKLFAQAQQAGLNTSTLHYNSGVAHYKLGHYQQAKAEFIKAEEGSESVALVHYNLGLSCYRLNQIDEARDWFQRTATEATEQRLADLADEMLAKLDGDVDTVAKESPWSLIADLMAGVDDNVTLENSDLAQVTNLKDSYLDLYAAARYQFSGDRKEGYWGQLSASSLKYRQYGAYDYSQYDAGLFKDSAYTAFSTRIGARVSRSDIGGSKYLQKYALRFQGDYPLAASQLLRARYDISWHDPLDSRYSYLAGLKHGLALESLWRIEGRRFKVGYELESNNRDDYRLNNNFTSYSATRHELSASATLPVAENWQITLGGDYRKSNYNDANMVAGVTDVRREDVRWRFNLGAEYHLNRYLDLVAEYHYTSNDSNIATMTYRRNQYELGVQGYF